MSYLTKSTNLGRSSWYYQGNQYHPYKCYTHLYRHTFLKGKTVSAKMGISCRPQRVSCLPLPASRLWHVFGQKGGDFLPFRSFRFQLRWAFPGQRRARPPTESSLYTLIVLIITIRNSPTNNLGSMKKSTTSTESAKKNKEQACRSQWISDSCKTCFRVEGVSSSVTWGPQNLSKLYHPVTVNLARGFHHLHSRRDGGGLQHVVQVSHMAPT